MLEPVLRGTDTPIASPPPAPDAKKSPLDDSDAARLKYFREEMGDIDSRVDASLSRARSDNARLEDFFVRNKPPEFKPIPPPKPQETSMMEAWGSLAMVFAALGSLFTRTPMTTAMNAGAAALKAIKQGDVERAKASYDQWKEANTQALDLAKYQQDAYKELMSTVERREKNNIDLTKAEVDGLRAKATAIATAFKDETALYTLQERRIEGFQKLLDSRDWHEKQIAVQQEKISAQVDKMQEQIDAARAEGEARQTPEYQTAVKSGDQIGAMRILAAANPKYETQLAKLEEQKKLGEEKEALAQERFEDSTGKQAADRVKEWKAQHPGASLDEETKAASEIYSSYKSSSGARLLPAITPESRPYWVKQLGEYWFKAPSMLQMARQPGWEGVIEDTEKAYPGWNPAKIEVVQRARQKLETGKDADAIASYTRLNQHLEFFQGLVDRLGDTSDIKSLNAIAKAWGIQTGNPNVTSYNTALELVGDEVVKAVTGTGAAGALGDREAIKKNFDPSLDKDQLKANINAVKALVGGAIVSTREKYKTLLPVDELDAIFPSRDVMENFHIDPDTGKVKVEGIYDFGGVKTQITPDGPKPIAQPQAAQPAAGAAPKPKIGSAINPKTGKEEKTYSFGGKTVFGDGTPAPRQ